MYGGQRLTRFSEESLVHLSVSSEKVTMTSLIHESTCQKEKAVIKYIFKTKGYIPVWKQGKLIDHDWRNSNGDIWSTFKKDHSSSICEFCLRDTLMKTFACFPYSKKILNNRVLWSNSTCLAKSRYSRELSTYNQASGTQQKRIFYSCAFKHKIWRYLAIGHWIVWWVLFKKASDLSSYADLLNATEGSHAVFISYILPLKWCTICEKKCSVLSDQPSLSTNMFSESLFWLWSPWSVAVLPPALLSRKCFCGPHMLWVLSAGLTPHAAHTPLGAAQGCKWGMGGRAWTGETRRGWRCLHGAPPLHLGQASLSGSLVPSDGETSQDDSMDMQKL